MTSDRQDQRDTPCGHWVDGRGHCGATPTRHYLPGRRCQRHTPAALAGKPEPGQTATGWPRTPTAPAPQSAGYQAIDARAIARGKRRAGRAEYQAARDEVQTQKQRDRDLKQGS